jgi:hypothetical protein
MGSIPIALSNSLGYRHESPGMTRFMNSSNMGTVKLSNFDNIRNLCIYAEG